MFDEAIRSQKFYKFYTGSFNSVQRYVMAYGKTKSRITDIPNLVKTFVS